MKIDEVDDGTGLLPKWKLVKFDIWDYRADVLSLAIKGQKRKVKVDLIAKQLRQAYQWGKQEAVDFSNDK